MYILKIIGYVTRWVYTSWQDFQAVVWIAEGGIYWCRQFWNKLSYGFRCQNESCDAWSMLSNCKIRLYILTLVYLFLFNIFVIFAILFFAGFHVLWKDAESGAGRNWNVIMAHYYYYYHDASFKKIFYLVV